MEIISVCKQYLGWCPNTPAIRTAPVVLMAPPENIHPAQPIDGGSAGSPGRIRYGATIAIGSLKAIFRDRQLLRFTFLSGLVMLFLIAVEEFIATQNAYIVTHLDNSLSFIISYPPEDPLIVYDTRFFDISIPFGDSFFSFDVRLFVIEMFCLFCFTVLLACLVIYRTGKGTLRPPTIRESIAGVSAHARSLATLSVTMALFGALLNAIIFQTQFFGKIVFMIEMAVFNLPYAYYLQGEPIYMAVYYSFEIMFINIILFLVALYVVPVIVLEKKGLVPALAGSVTLMRRTWRELLGCAVIYGAIVLGVAAIALVIGQSPYLLNHDFDFFINMSRGQLLMMTVCFLFLTGCWVTMAAGFTTAGIAITDLYSCGTETLVKKEPETGSTAAIGPAT
jgi:hypothetical protein